MQKSRTALVSIRNGALLAALLVMALPGYPPSAGEIYKSVDDQGHVVYSDRAISPGAKKSTLEVEQPNPTEVERLAKQQQQLNAQDAQRKRQDALDEKKKAEEDRQKKARQERCENARNRYYRLRDARRVYQLDHDGNRIYSSGADLDAEREGARKDMAAACGT